MDFIQPCWKLVINRQRKCVVSVWNLLFFSSKRQFQEGNQRGVFPLKWMQCKFCLIKWKISFCPGEWICASKLALDYQNYTEHMETRAGSKYELPIFQIQSYKVFFVLGGFACLTHFASIAIRAEVVYLPFWFESTMMSLRVIRKAYGLSGGEW